MTMEAGARVRVIEYKVSTKVNDFEDSGRGRKPKNAVSRNWKMQENRSFPRASEGMQPCCPLILM